MLSEKEKEEAALLRSRICRSLFVLIALALISAAATRKFGTLNGFAIVAAVWLLMPEVRWRGY